MKKYANAVKLLFLGVIFLAFSLVQAYPEMIRYGYVNCSSCHISLTGGSILSDYGRQLSSEELAIWKSDNEKSKEPEFAYGVLSETPVQKWLKMGGDVRAVYYYQNTPTSISGQTIFMQGDLDAAIQFNHFTVVGAAGATQPGYAKDVEFISRMHYIQYDFTDTVHVRGGKFLPAYGVNTPDHDVQTKQPLELGQNYESYNLEVSYISDQWNWFVTGVFGRPDKKELNRDRGGALQGSFAPTEKIKIGLNAWYGKKDETSRWLFGGFVLAGITEKFFASTEIDVKDYVDGDHGLASTQRLSYELTEGLWVYGMQEYGTSNIPDTSSKSETYGFGFQIFPRTHFELNLAYERVLNQLAVTGQQDTSSSIDVAWFMSHFYF